MLEKFFKLKENNTDVKTEVLAGITTFMTMAYILAVNPGILAEAGMDQGAALPSQNPYRLPGPAGRACSLSGCIPSGRSFFGRRRHRPHQLGGAGLPFGPGGI